MQQSIPSLPNSSTQESDKDIDNDTESELYPTDTQSTKSKKKPSSSSSSSIVSVDDALLSIQILNQQTAQIKRLAQQKGVSLHHPDIKNYLSSLGRLKMVARQKIDTHKDSSLNDLSSSIQYDCDNSNLLEKESDSNNSDIDKTSQLNPYYFIIENAYLSYEGNNVIIKKVDKINGICSIAYPNNPSNIVENNIPLSQIKHILASIKSNTSVKVVYGKMSGEIGALIGIDNEEAIVQMSSTNEVCIVDKKLIVCFVND